MSTNDTAVLPTGPEPEGRGGKRTALIAGGTAAALLLGGGAFAAWQLLGAKGPAPEEALPASTAAVVTIDLDPSAGQKVAAFKTLRKFPALKDELGLKDDDDLRKVIFDKIQEEGCEGLSYKDEVEPWLGKRAALAAVDLGGDMPSPAFVVQVNSKDEASSGVQRILESCGKPDDDFGFTVTDDFLVVSDSDEHAKQIVTAGEKKPLVDDATYAKWADELGDAGVLNIYIAKKAVEYFVDFTAGEQVPAEGVEEALGGFKGAAATLRFGDGGVEFAAVGGIDSKYVGDTPVGKLVSGLPADTALTVALGVPDDFAKTMLDQLRSTVGADVLDAELAQVEAQTGLEVPEDLQTLLGDGLALALGADAPKSLDAMRSPADVPAGLVARGDTAKMRSVLDKLQQGTGFQLADLGIATRDGDGKLALATSDGYANSLLKDGGLGSDDGFKSVVPNVDKASSLLYIDFDSAWIDRILEAADGMGAPESISANITPLKGLGISSWAEGDLFRAVLKLSTN